MSARSARGEAGRRPAGARRDVLVVKTPKAAADKALKQLDSGMHSTGLTVRRTLSGALAAVLHAVDEEFAGRGALGRTRT